MFRRGGGRMKWWTRERVILGLQRFYEDFGFCPVSTEKYMEHSQFTGVDPATGKHSNRGHHNRYPSSSTVRNYFQTMREAWEAAGFDCVDHAYMEWRPIEDWFVLESVGILPRSEVSAALKRSVPAIKRRLYDLGDIRSYNRWGITLNGAEKLLGLPMSVIKKYLDYGVIPFFRGHKLIYLNPADLLKVDEVDFTKVSPECEQLIRRAIAQRIAKMIKFGSSWRDHEIYKFQPTKERYAGRIKNPRKSGFAGVLPPVPNDLSVDDWVKLTRNMELHLKDARNRVGVIKHLHYSPQASRRYDGTRRACWIARVEFPKIRTITNETSRRIKYSIPLDRLERAEKPQPEPRPLSMHPEAIRGRRRFAEGLVRARGRFTEIRSELS